MNSFTTFHGARTNTGRAFVVFQDFNSRDPRRFLLAPGAGYEWGPKPTMGRLRLAVKILELTVGHRQAIEVADAFAEEVLGRLDADPKAEWTMWSYQVVQWVMELQRARQTEK